MTAIDPFDHLFHGFAGVQGAKGGWVKLIFNVPQKDGTKPKILLEEATWSSIHVQFAKRSIKNPIWKIFTFIL